MGKHGVLYAKAFLIIAGLCCSAAVVIQISTSPARGGETTVDRENPRTIGHEFLDMEKDLGSSGRHYAVLERLIRTASAKISPRKSYTTRQAVRTLGLIHTILKDEGFVYRNNLLLSIGLERKIIDCDNYCALYVSIAEVLKIPIIPVYAPNHSFVRFYFDDGSYLNWETTEGRPRPNSYYIEKLKIPADSINRGVYLKSLSRREFIAVEYNNLGAYRMTAKQYNSAVPYLDTAIQLYPLFSSAYHNRGTSYYAMKRPAEALRDLLKARELDPSRASTRNTLGDIYFDRKEYNAALREYSASIKLDPTNFAPYRSVGLIMKIRGEMDKARKWLRKSAEIRKKYRGLSSGPAL